MAKLKIVSNIGELQSLVNDVAVKVNLLETSLNDIDTYDDKLVDSITQLLEKFNDFELTVSVPFDPEVDSVERVNHYSSKCL
ncbi:hypothetical protein BDD43_5316 [Mucilaginibacter gracilis]|uniref:Uncharacterized protein n=1 Tax=Mucilaginibacter gracilis TaxID=423350 RepID=A0A495J7U4_9SPHI|nr:hypothetical protein BDD43_5316 [Mucilaginibacter gracilis]